MSFLTGSILTDILLAVLLLCYFIYWFITNNDDYWEKRGVPHTKTGLIWTNLKGKKSQADAVNDLYKRFAHEKYFGFFQVRQPILMINDLDLIHKVLVKDFTHFQDRGQPQNEKELLSKNLFNLNGQVWRTMRYKLTPTFTTGKLKGMFEQVSNCGENMVVKIRELSKQGDVDSKDFLFEFTSEVISSCAFGLQFEPSSKEFALFKTIVQKMFRPSYGTIFKFIFVLMCPELARFLNFNLFISKENSQYFLNMIKSTSQYRKENKIKRNDYLQLLLTLQELEEKGQDMGLSTADISEDDAVIDQMKYTESNDQSLTTTNIKLFTDEAVTANSVIFLVAGSESASNTISLALFELACHLEIQLKLQQEIDSVLAEHGGWSYQAIKEMTYLDQVIQETQRLYPLLPFLMRQCTKQYRMPGSDLVIEKGVRVAVPVIGLHKDPQYYPDPEVFRPERFEGNNFKPNSTFLPFGDGPRICIAMRFAVMEMKTSIARILANYTVKLSSKTTVPLKLNSRSFVPMPETGIWLTFEERNK